MEKVSDMIAHYQNAIDGVDELHDVDDLEEMGVIYYSNASDCGGVLDQKMNNAIARDFAFSYGATLIEFKPEEYANWLIANFDEITDTPERRAEWGQYKAAGLLLHGKE